ncbi:hypothetical protein SAMN03097699_2791 [Flavobacteriaceae bacterium MAR_2010_188]|nr:hypothetical protein SAMN03097699_2791 [Flavobacteriaceae bacterium MAR_2010_188]
MICFQIYLEPKIPKPVTMKALKQPRISEANYAKIVDRITIAVFQIVIVVSIYAVVEGIFYILG